MKNSLRKGGALLGSMIVLLSAYSCSNSSSDSGVTGTAPVAVTMKADFTSTGAPSLFKAAAVKLASCPTPTAPDGPNLIAGLDCDENGGFTAYLTPESFKVAIKRLSFVKSDGGQVDFVPDQGTLANSLVYDISSEFTITQLTIPAGTYASVQAEIYYYEIRMPLNSAPTITQSIRVYLSDDDFTAEGSIGHHQGDITFVDDNGSEIGWVVPGDTWTLSSLQTITASVIRPGSTDAETLHQRGPFGDSDLWDQLAFRQGANQDIFLIDALLGLTVSADISKTVTFTFSVKDSWFWEDFDDDGRFDPCESGLSAIEACAQGSKWAPIFNLPILSFQ